MRTPTFFSAVILLATGTFSPAPVHAAGGVCALPLDRVGPANCSEGDPSRAASGDTATVFAQDAYLIPTGGVMPRTGDLVAASFVTQQVRAETVWHAGAGPFFGTGTPERQETPRMAAFETEDDTFGNLAIGMSEVVEIPLPATGALLAGAMGVLGVFRRRKPA